MAAQACTRAALRRGSRSKDMHTRQPSVRARFERKAHVQRWHATGCARQLHFPLRRARVGQGTLDRGSYRISGCAERLTVLALDGTKQILPHQLRATLRAANGGEDSVCADPVGR